MTTYSRICIFGRPGSGKSTFSQELHSKTDLPLHHLDKHFFTSNWVSRNYQEFLSIQENIVQQEQWIIDGNSLQSLEMRFARADVVIYFNYSRLLCLWRLLKRRFLAARHTKDTPEGCPEALRFNLLKYMWTFEYRQNNRLAKTYFRIKNSISPCYIY